MIETVERRVLGALRWLDAVTGSPVTRPLSVDCPGVGLLRKADGLYVLMSAPGFSLYTNTFDLRDLPAAEVLPDGSRSLSGQVTDPSGYYLARSFRVALPRSGNPPGPTVTHSTFQPIELRLLPGPQAKVQAGWVELRVTTLRASGEPFPHVLVRVRGIASAKVLGRGMSDARGEALILVPDLPLFQAGEDPKEIVTSRTPARLEFLPPPAGELVVDWTLQDARLASEVAPENLRTTPLALEAGGRSALTFTVKT
jgi:hypothetical protein